MRICIIRVNKTHLTTSSSSSNNSSASNSVSARFSFLPSIGLGFFTAPDVEEEVAAIRHKNCPVSLLPCARDAYLLFQVRL